MILKRKHFFTLKGCRVKMGQLLFSPHKTLISFELCVLLTDKTKQ